MKKLLLMIVGVLIALPAFARDFTYTYEGQTLTYTVLNESAKICQTKAGTSSAGNNVSGALTIPEKAIDGENSYSVIAIGDYAFYNCSGLTSVNVPNSVKTIGSSAFANCSLEEIYYAATEPIKGTEDIFTSPSSAVYKYATLYVPAEAVEKCKLIDPWKNFNNIVAHNFGNDDEDDDVLNYQLNDDGTATVLPLAQGNYSGDIVIPSSITRNGKTYTVTAIGDKAFYRASSLTSIEIPNSVTSIGNEAFCYCSRLTSIEIPNSVTTIGSSAFYNCGSLTSINIPGSVTSIGSNAFGYCESLTKAEFASIESICSIKFGDYESNPLYYAKKLYINGAEIKNLVIPNSVTSIGNYAFYGCGGLTSVTIGTSVSSVGDYAFCGCTGLTSVEIPNSVTEIGINAFYNCSGLTSIEIPNSVTSIGSGAFYDCTGLTSVNIGESVSSIDNYAFANCTGLTSINIPNSVKTIGYGAFVNCKSVTSVYIPGSVTSMATQAFGECTSLTSVYYNATDPIEYSEFAFYNSDGYSKATLYVPAEAVEKCKQIDPWKYFTNIVAHNFGNDDEDDDVLNYQLNDDGTAMVIALAEGKYTGDIVIPSSITRNDKTYTVTGIGSQAFDGCRDLTSITIPNSVTFIGNYAFNDCKGLTKAEFASIESICSIQFADYGSNPLFYAKKLYINGEEIKNLVIPNSVTSIGDWAFYFCSGLTSVTIPNSVTSIGNYAFEVCSGLTSLEIPNSVTSIGNYAFYGCFGLTSVKIPDSIKTIGEEAFALCEKLEAVYYAATEPIEADSYIFSTDAYSNATLYVPEEAVEKCKLIDPWKNFNNIVAHNFGNDDEDEDVLNYQLNDDGTATVLPLAQGNYSGDIVIPSTITRNGKTYTVTAIGEDAFYYCSGLTSITIPNSVTSIGDWAFCGCSGLTSVTIPNSVTSIGNYAFFLCSGLTSLTIPNSVTEIGYAPFAYCEKLLSIDVEPSNSYFTSINGVLYNIEKTTLIQYPAGKEETHFEIPNSVTSIGDWAFSGCSGLTSVTIGKYVETIDHLAFYSCDNLKTLYFNAENCTQCGEFVDNNKVAPVFPKNLENIYIGEEVTNIPELAFIWSSIETIKIPDSVKAIGQYAFYDCGDLTYVSIPNSVTEIGWGAFAWCDKLEAVYYAATEPIESASNVFSYTAYSNATLYVPEEAVEKCKQINPWKNFANIEAHDFTGVETIENDAIVGDKPCEVYNINGVMVGTSTENLRPGLYIVRQGGNVKKITVK